MVQESHFSVTLCCKEKHNGTSKYEIILMGTVVRNEGLSGSIHAWEDTDSLRFLCKENIIAVSVRQLSR